MEKVWSHLISSGPLLSPSLPWDNSPRHTKWRPQLHAPLAPPALQAAEAVLLRNIIKHKTQLSLSCQFVIWDFNIYMYMNMYVVLPPSALLLVYSHAWSCCISRGSFSRQIPLDSTCTPEMGCELKIQTRLMLAAGPTWGKPLVLITWQWGREFYARGWISPRHH